MNTEPLQTLVSVNEELQEQHRIEVRRWQMVCAVLLVLGLLGVLGWQMGAREQDKAKTNAQVAQAGATLADQLDVICDSDDPKVIAFADKYKLCEQAADVKSLAPSIDAEGAPAIPVQTIVVPGDTVTSFAMSTTTATQTVPGPTLSIPGKDVFVTVTSQPSTATVPGPATTELVTMPAETRTVEVAGPTSTETRTVTEPAVTETVQVPGPETTVTSTETVTPPAVTETITVPGPDVTVTVTVTGDAPPPVTDVVTDPPATITDTVTIDPPVVDPPVVAP